MSEWLRQLNSVWLQRLEEAKDAKRTQFGDTAEILWNYLTKNYKELYILGLGGPGAIREEDAPYYKPRINKFQEFVDLYMPFVLGRTPVRRVSVRRPQFPEEVMRSAAGIYPVPFSAYDARVRMSLDTAAILLEWWLNFCADEYKLMREARLAVMEALVKGRGIVWHGLQPTANGLIPASFYETVDNIFIDPSAITLRDAGFIFRKRRLSSWLASRQLGIEENRLLQMCQRQLEKQEDEPKTDLPIVEYYEVYSRIGSGAFMADPEDPLRDVQEALDELGPHVWFAIAPGAEYPLNLDPEVIQGSPDRLRAAVEWPIATYGDMINPWPMSVLDFYPHISDPWARSPLQAGLPYQRFLDDLYGYLMSQAVKSARLVFIVPDHTDASLERALQGGSSVEVVKVSTTAVSDFARELYHIVEMPPVKPDLWNLITTVNDHFARAVGLDPVLYGSQPDTQPRSAAEVQIRYRAASGRAQNMADQVEEWMSSVAQKEGLLTRLYIPYTQTAQLFGEPLLSAEEGQPPLPGGPLTQTWASVINTNDPIGAGMDFHFSVLSGSGRRKDKEQQIQGAMFIAQTLLGPAIQAAAKTGDFSMFNRILERLSNAMDLDLSLFRMEPQQAVPTTPTVEGESNGPKVDATSSQTSGGVAG